MLAWEDEGLTTQQIAGWTVPVVIFCVATLFALGARQLLLRTASGRIHLNALRGPSVLWCVAIGLAIAIHNANPPPTLEYWAQKSIGVFTIISIGLVAASITVRAVSAYGERRSYRLAGLSRTLINLIIFAIVLLMILSQFDVEIKPFLTALGVGGLAVALALQDTLANLFAGVLILVEEPIRVGDFISISKEEEGLVRDIGWRTTRIQTGNNAVIVIPNQKITSGNLTNFSLPDPNVAVDVVLMTAHDADPNKVAEIAMDAAYATEGVLEVPAPSVWFEPGILQTHMQMKLVVHVANVQNRARVASQIRAKVHQGFIQHNVAFPVVKV